MARIQYGTRVRFRMDGIGLMARHHVGKVADETVGRGDLGTVRSLPDGEGWFWVQPDLYPELLAPVTTDFVEPV